MYNQVKIVHIFLFIMLGSYSSYSQGTVDTLDSLGNIVSTWNYSAEENFKLINAFEKYSFKSGIDSLKVLYRDKPYFLVRHVSHFYKMKIELYDIELNLVRENFFDTLQQRLSRSIWKNASGNIVKTYDNNGFIWTEIDYYDSGQISNINVFNEKENRGVLNMLFDSLGNNTITFRYLPEERTFLCTSYWPNSTQKCVEYYESYEPTPYYEYHLDGTLRMKGKIYGMPINWVGKWQEWHENGQLSREFLFHESTPNFKLGVWKWWDEDGNLIKEETYKDNELIKENILITPIKD